MGGSSSAPKYHSFSYFDVYYNVEDVCLSSTWSEAPVYHKYVGDGKKIIYKGWHKSPYCSGKSTYESGSTKDGPFVYEIPDLFWNLQSFWWDEEPQTERPACVKKCWCDGTTYEEGSLPPCLCNMNWIVISGAFSSKNAAVAARISFRNATEAAYLAGVEHDMKTARNLSQSDRIFVLGNRAASSNTCLSHIRDVCSSLRDADVPVGLYYTGHGIVETGELVFADALVSAAELTSTVLETLMRPLDLIVCDSCYSGRFVRDTIIAGGALKGISACGDSEPAYDFPDIGGALSFLCHPLDTLSEGDSRIPVRQTPHLFWARK